MAANQTKKLMDDNYEFFTIFGLKKFSKIINSWLGSTEEVQRISFDSSRFG